MTNIGADVETYLLPYSQVIAVVSTAIIAISAAITAILTWRLIRDNRKLSKVGTEPEIIAYLAADPFQPFTNFVLANVGRGPARNVEFELALEADHYDRMVLRYEPNRKPQGFLLQGEKIEILFGDHRLFGVGEAREKNALPPFEVVVKWQNLGDYIRAYPPPSESTGCVDSASRSFSKSHSSFGGPCMIERAMFSGVSGIGSTSGYGFRMSPPL